MTTPKLPDGWTSVAAGPDIEMGDKVGFHAHFGSTERGEFAAWYIHPDTASMLVRTDVPPRMPWDPPSWPQTDVFFDDSVPVGKLRPILHRLPAGWDAGAGE